MTQYMTVLAVVAVPDGTDPDELHERIGRDGLREHVQYLQLVPFRRPVDLVLNDLADGSMDPDSWEDPWPTVIDFVVFDPDEPEPIYGQRKPGESMADALRPHIPDLASQGMGRLRTWSADEFTADMKPNPIANTVIDRLGYHHEKGWRGPVAVTMQEVHGGFASLLPEVRQTIDELLA